SCGHRVASIGRRAVRRKRGSRSFGARQSCRMSANFTMRGPGGPLGDGRIPATPGATTRLKPRRKPLDNQCMRVFRHTRWVLSLVLTVFLAGCSSGLKRPVVTAQAEPNAQGVQRVVVEMHSFYFKPNRIEVHAGHPVELVLQNKARLVPHNFTI